jgi:hypothetical protein
MEATRSTINGVAVSHPVFRRIPSGNYMCAHDVHTTYIATNMENIKNNALLYIEHSYNKTYNYYESIAETILNLLFGAPYSIGMVDWGSTRLVLLETFRKLFTGMTIWYPSGIFIGDNDKRQLTMLSKYNMRLCKA